MAFETVTGYCWPQSVVGGRDASGCTCRRPVDGPCPSRWRASGPSARSCSRDAAVPADDHPTPARCAQPTGAAGRRRCVLDVDPAWRSGYYEVVLEIDVDGKRRREPRVLRRAARDRCADRADPAGAVHQHLARLQRLRRPQPLHGRHPGVAAAADVARATCTSRRGSVGGSPSIAPARPADGRARRLPRGSTTCRRTPGSAGWPDWELPFLAVGRARGLRHRRRHQRRPRGPPRAAPGRRAATAVPVRRARRVLVGPDARHRRGLHRPAVATPPSSPATPPFWQVRLEDPTPEGPAATMVGYKGFFKQRPGVRHRSGRPSSPASGRTTSSSGPRTT